MYKNFSIIPPVDLNLKFEYAIHMYISDAISGWAGWALAHPEFGGVS